MAESKKSLTLLVGEIALHNVIYISRTDCTIMIAIAYILMLLYDNYVEWWWSYEYFLSIGHCCLIQPL